VIAFLEGVVEDKAADRVVVSVNGIGYEVLVPAPTLGRLPPVGGGARIYTRVQIRDEAMVMFGFASLDERQLFDHLVTVSGVGPKMALGVLSVLAPDALRRAVAAGDVDALCLAPGVGKKVAGRIVLELKDRIGAGGDVATSGPMAEVREALLALGLSPQEARDAVVSLPADDDRPVEDLLRRALQGVGRS
jgi:Holliday junction DNA helicase RuvA